MSRLPLRLAMIGLLSLPLAGAVAAPAPPAKASAAIAAAVASPARKPANRARDAYRHPAETLAFFGVTPAKTVVEVFPGGGWYAEILAPMLAAQGKYIAAVEPGKSQDAVRALFASDPARFGKATTTLLDPAKDSAIAPAGSADVVLTFRNVHNLLMDGDPVAARAFADFYRALKPGGVLGVVDHRLPEAADAARERTSGYVKRSTVVRLAEAAGFRLDGESEVNANPKDSANWPKGVWTLPPTFAEGATDRAKYAAIGESDRMTLRFVKPKR